MKLDYFKNINTYRKAYFLGFILGDGAIVADRRGRFTLTLTIHQKDKYILEEFAKDIGSDRMPYDVKDYQRVGRLACRFTIGTSEFVNHLMDQGVLPRKSLTAECILHNVPKKYRGAFLLGLWDADGCLTFDSNLNLKGFPRRQYWQLRCTFPIAMGIVSEFNLEKYNIDFNASIPMLRMGTKEEIVKILSIMYHRCPVYLKRKREKFDQLLNQVQTIS